MLAPVVEPGHGLQNANPRTMDRLKRKVTNGHQTKIDSPANQAAVKVAAFGPWSHFSTKSTVCTQRSQFLLHFQRQKLIRNTWIIIHNASRRHPDSRTLFASSQIPLSAAKTHQRPRFFPSYHMSSQNLLVRSRLVSGGAMLKEIFCVQRCDICIRLRRVFRRPARTCRATDTWPVKWHEIGFTTLSSRLINIPDVAGARGEAPSSAGVTGRSREHLIRSRDRKSAADLRSTCGDAMPTFLSQTKRVTSGPVRESNPPPRLPRTSIASA